MQLKITLGNIIDVIVFLIIYAFLITYFTPELMLSSTTTTGGDMGSHYVISQYLKDFLLPHGQLIGWYPHWMAGIPLLQFYFIPPYLLIVLLSYLIPLQIAFKLVTILGIFLLPICAYAAFRLFGFNFPTPSIAATMTLPFLFMESYSFYGGNIKSTLAGQFPHGISFALTLLSVALIFYGLKRRKYLALNAILLSLAVLTHVYTTIVLVGTLALFFIEALVHKEYAKIKYLIYLGILTTLLTSFWIIPLFAKFSFTAAPKDNFSGGLGDAFINDFVLFYALALMCIVFPLIRNIFNFVIYSIIGIKHTEKSKTSSKGYEMNVSNRGQAVILIILLGIFQLFVRFFTTDNITLIILVVAPLFVFALLLIIFRKSSIPAILASLYFAVDILYKLAVLLGNISSPNFLWVSVGVIISIGLDVLIIVLLFKKDAPKPAPVPLTQTDGEPEIEERTDFLGVINIDNRLMPLYFFLLSSALFYVMNDHTILLRIRFLPQLYFLPLLLAAVGIGLIASRLKAGFIVPILTVLFITTWISTGIVQYLPDDVQKDLSASPYLSHGVKDIPGWIKWNYEGVESKAKWPTYKALTEYMATLDNSGRINVEYSTDYNSYGTPRLFEASPIFTNRSVMEGLLLESSVTYPFLYYLNKEVSHDSWWPGFPIKEPKINLTQGAKDLALYNVKYFVVGSDLIKGQIKDYPEYTYLKSIGEFEIYSLNNDSQYIEPLKKEPVLVVTDDWKSFSFQWMTSVYKNVPLVFTRDYGEYESTHFRLVILDKQIPVRQSGNIKIFTKDQLMDALAPSQDLPGCSVSMKEISEEEFLAQTDCIGKPVYFKTSYFPNWMAQGAGKIYMASPSTMLLFPEAQDLRIYYGTTPADYIGALLTIIGILTIIYSALLSRKSFREKVHDPWFNSLLAIQPIVEVLKVFDKIKTQGKNFYSLLMRKKLLIIVFGLLVIVGYAMTIHFSESSKCSSYCTSQGSSSSSQSFFGFGDTVDSYHLGYSHGEEGTRHNFVCQSATCDPSRTDQVYVSSGYVEFDMTVKPKTENELTLRLLDNTNCRSADLYIDGEFYRNITGEGIYDWHDFVYSIPSKYLAKDKIKVKLQYNNSDCYGWDLAIATIKTPACKCME